MNKKRILFLLITAMTLLCVTAAVVIPCIADNDKDDYVRPTYLVDFADANNVARSFDSHSCSPVHDKEQQAMQILFAGNNQGVCEDPYINLALPTETVNVTQYHYLAMLVKTDYTALLGEIRLRSETTQNQYPFFRYTYQDTTDWQLIIVDITKVAAAGAYPQNMTIDGALSNLRLDMFNNSCKDTTTFYLKAYALYDSYEDAQTFIHFESEVNQAPVKPDIDYSAFWKGEAFGSPANKYRMNWLSYGFNSTYAAQVDALLTQGYGGIVSNVNFNQQYLKDEKEFELLLKTYQYAKDKDMTLWIYDEYQWPSGSAYGQVLDTNEAWRATGIEHIQITLKKATYTYTPRTDIDLEIKLATVKAGGKTWTLDPNGTSLQFDLTNEIDGECLLDIYVLRYTDDHEQDRNDFSTLYHVDTLRPDSVACFIELTHQHYKNAFGNNFSLVEAFFTDEPSQGNRDMENYIVWTEGFEQKFKDTYGYELELPLLFEGRTEQAQRMRIHYYSLVASLFKTSYIDQISDWCEQNGTISSGHLLFEENMNDHVETYGGDFMQIIGGMTMPGVDILWVHPNQLLSQCFIGNHLGIRFVVSAARNAGKTDVMVEYNPSAVSTSDFENDKLGASIGGITLTRLFGTTVYNVINPQKDYTLEELNTLNTYVGRLNTLLDGAVEAGDVAVFYPIATVQALHNADDVHSSAYGKGTDAVKLNDNYTQLCLDLLQRQVLYSVIDDQSICAATITADGRMVIGNGSYRTLVMAYGEYISADAAQKLAQFKQAGGTVVFVGTGYADYKAIQESGNERVLAAMAQLADCEQFSLSAAPSKIAKLATYTLKLSKINGLTSKNVLYGEFTTSDHDIAYVANSSNIDATASLKFTDGYEGAYTVYYPYSGDVQTGSGNVVEIDLPAYCAVLIVREDQNTTDNTPFIPEGSDELNTETDTLPQGTDAEENVTEDAADKSGCKSAIGALPLFAAAAGAAVVLGKKKRK